LIGPSRWPNWRLEIHGSSGVRSAFLRILFAAATAALAATPAAADIRILASPGGQIGPYLQLFDKVRASGERVVIDGPCLSACTLVLMTLSRSRICVTPRAILGFHAASSRDFLGRRTFEPEATDLVLAAYPRPVRQWITRHGGLGSRLLLLHGRELAAMYPRCR
jgi:hypothetical protein